MNYSKIILDLAKCDIVSYGIVAQAFRYPKEGNDKCQLEFVLEVLGNLLSSKKIAIGDAMTIDSDYVEFVAWNADVGNLLSRARKAVVDSSESDVEFAFWICLPENVDRYE